MRFAEPAKGFTPVAQRERRVSAYLRVMADPNVSDRVKEKMTETRQLRIVAVAVASVLLTLIGSVAIYYGYKGVVQAGVRKQCYAQGGHYVKVTDVDGELTCTFD